VPGEHWPVTPEFFCAVALNDPARQEHLLAEVDGRPVGFALAKLSADTPPADLTGYTLRAMRGGGLELQQSRTFQGRQPIRAPGARTAQ